MLASQLMDHRAAKAYILARLKAELPASRTYHSLAHTLDVYAASIDIGEQEGISEADMLLLTTAALFHDSGFILQDLHHEEASCRLARENLGRWDYTEAEIERICGMIMATRIPQSPHDKLSRILCDADLDYLGRDDFFTVGDTLFEELRSYGVLKTATEWNTLQDQFLSRHSFHTATNKKLREPRKKEHLAAVRRKLAQGE